MVTVVAVLAIALLLPIYRLTVSGCTTPKGEGFAIYLTKGGISPAQMPLLSHIEIAEQPIIAVSEIITYDTKTHEIALATSAYERISKLEVPVSGKSFYVRWWSAGMTLSSPLSRRAR